MMKRKPVVAEKDEIYHRDEGNKLHFLEKLDQHEVEARTKTESKKIEYTSISVQSSVETTLGEFN